MCVARLTSQRGWFLSHPAPGDGGSKLHQRPNDVAGSTDIEILFLPIDRCEKFRGQMNCDAYNKQKTNLFIFVSRKFSRHPLDLAASVDPASLDDFRIDPPQAQFLPRREFTNFIASSPNRATNFLHPR